MNIGEVLCKFGFFVKIIWYYEDIGLVILFRVVNGYRIFCEIEFYKLVFLGWVWEFGFIIEDCWILLVFYENDGWESVQVKSVV